LTPKKESEKKMFGKEANWKVGRRFRCRKGEKKRQHPIGVAVALKRSQADCRARSNLVPLRDPGKGKEKSQQRTIEEQTRLSLNRAKKEKRKTQGRSLDIKEGETARRTHKTYVSSANVSSLKKKKRGGKELKKGKGTPRGQGGSENRKKGTTEERNIVFEVRDRMSGKMA